MLKSIKTLFIIAIFTVFQTPLRAKTEQKTDVRQDTNTVNLWLHKAKEKAAAKDQDSTELYIKKAGQLAEKLNFHNGQFKYMSQYAKLFYQQMRYQEGINIAQKMLNLAVKLGNKENISKAYNNMAIQYGARGNLELAAKNLLLALKVSEELNNLYNQSLLYSNLSSIYIDMKDKKNSLYYGRKSYEAAKKLKDSARMSLSLINLSISEALNGQMDQAILHLNECANISKKNNNTEMILEAYLKLGDVYKQKKDHKTALVHYKKALEILKNHPDKNYQIYVDFGLANSYNSLNNNQKAKLYFNKTLIGALPLMSKNDLKEVYLLGADLHEKLGQPIAALQLWKKYYKLNDSIFNANTQRAVQEMEVKYQTSLKEKALSQQKLQIASNRYELQKKNRFITIATIAIILLILVSIIVYLIHRNRNQSMRLHLLKAQIHPHFLFNTLNNLYALCMSKSDKSPAVVLGLAKILRYILYECDTSKVCLAKEIEIIEEYISLEKIRYNDRLEVNLNVKGDLLDYQIAPLLILPLAENAFKHGISKLVKYGWINIEIKIDKSQFYFKISNNKPSEQEDTAGPTKFGNIGLQNIKKRLKILYPNRHELKIIDEDDVFIVIMKITLDRSKVV